MSKAEAVDLKWKGLGIGDARIFKKLCDHHKINEPNMSKTLEKMEHSEGQDNVHVFKEEIVDGKTRHVRTGEKVLMDVVFIRTRGKGSVHRVWKSAKENIWLCECPTWKFKGGRKQLKPCRHILYCIVNKIGDAEDWLQYIV